VIGKSAGKSFAYILGVFLGDGCVSMSGTTLSFRLNTIDEDFALATKAALGELTSRNVTINEHPVKKSKNPNFALWCGCLDLAQTLVNDTDKKQRIPEYVWQWTKAEKLAFIAGLFDSEGFVCGAQRDGCTVYYMGFKSCDVWVPDFIRLLQSVGLQVGKISQEKPRRTGYKTPTRFHVKMRSFVESGAYFQIRRKMQRVEAWAEQQGAKLTSEANTPDTPMAA
jgi:intein-encoded DNA endonuclease-like protein